MLRSTLLLVLLGLIGLAAAGPAPECDAEACVLPDCRCSTTQVPGGHDPADIPQIVYLTFNEALTTTTDGYFEKLFNDPDLALTNPNGCPFRATHFVSHVNTDYQLVNKWYTRGHEFGVLSISHESNTTYWTHINQTGWELEMAGMKDIIANFAKVPKDNIVGVRAPYQQNGGDLQFGVLDSNGFVYDSSLPTRYYAFTNMADAMWPYTLDYRSSQDCQIPPCPYSSFPGVWEQPLLMLEDSRDDGSGTGYPCSYLEACLGYPDANPQHIFDLLLKNFDRAYTGNRAPFGIHLQAAYFVPPQEWHFDGYKMFLEYLSSLDDVYVVTMQEGLAFVREPRSLADLADFEPFGCDHLPNVAPCSPGARCKFSAEDLPGNVGDSGEKYLSVCGQRCPASYPWIGNPLGE